MIILESDIFMRNYISTGAFDLILDDECEIVVINADKKYRKKKYNFDNHITFINCQYGALIRYINQLTFDIGITKNFSKSSSFRYRYHITISQAIDFSSSFSSSRIRSSITYVKLRSRFSNRAIMPYVDFLLVNTLRITRFYKFLSKLPYRFVISILVLPYIYGFFQKLRRLISPCIELQAIISRSKPDLIIYPSTAYSIVGEDILKLSNKGRIFKTLFLIDNWDNLSSKSVFEDKPSYLGVWGEQSKKHAIEIQDCNPDNIHILGTPRYLIYEMHKHNNKEKLGKVYEFPYILFLGMGGLGYDEIGALKKVSQVLSENRELFPEGCKIVYRPHPWGRGMVLQNEFNQLFDDNIVLDKQLEEHFHSEIYFKDRSFQPSLDYYPSLLSNSSIVVGGPTTMVMEALLLKKNVVLLSYDDGNEVNLKKQFKTLEHFKGLEGIQSLFVVNDIEDIRTAMLAAYCVEWSDAERSVINDKLSYYIRINLSEGPPYTERLKECIAKITENIE